MDNNKDDPRDPEDISHEPNAVPVGEPTVPEDGDRLALNEDDRLPWLESADDAAEEGVDGGRVFSFVLAALLGLVVLVGGIWMFSHRGPDRDQVADGSTIPAPAEPYKKAPGKDGGKTFAGTGDTSYKVSEGKSASAKLDDGAKPGFTSVDASTPAADEAAGGVGVQVGAYTSRAQAEAGWTRLTGQTAVLKDVKHRIVEGSADIGTVFRLQAVAADGGAADALCASLKAGGIACQVKR